MFYTEVLFENEKHISQWPSNNKFKEGLFEMVLCWVKTKLSRKRHANTKINDHNPWSEYVGMFLNDPDWDEFQKSIHRYRRKEIDFE